METESFADAIKMQLRNKVLCGSYKSMATVLISRPKTSKDRDGPSTPEAGTRTCQLQIKKQLRLMATTRSLVRWRTALLTLILDLQLAEPREQTFLWFEPASCDTASQGSEEEESTFLPSAGWLAGAQGSHQPHNIAASS